MISTGHGDNREPLEEKVEEKLAKLREYLRMESEITFQEFKNYYAGLLERLNAGYGGFNQEECLQARFICSIVKANANARAPRDKANAKAFRKMAAKCAFWIEAIDYRLKKEGLGSAGIEKAMAEISGEPDSKGEPASQDGA